MIELDLKYKVEGDVKFNVDSRSSGNGSTDLKADKLFYREIQHATNHSIIVVIDRRELSDHCCESSQLITVRCKYGIQFNGVCILSSQ